MENITFSTLLKLGQLIETLDDEDLVALLNNVAAEATKSAVANYRLAAEDGGIQEYLGVIGEYGTDFLENISKVEAFIVDYIENELGDAERAAKVQIKLYKQKTDIDQKINQFVNDIGEIVLETNAQEISNAAAKATADQAKADEMRQNVTENTASPVMNWGK